MRSIPSSNLPALNPIPDLVFQPITIIMKGTERSNFSSLHKSFRQDRPSELPTLQRALVVSAIGQPLELTSRPIPQPQHGELLVQVSVAGLNPHDSKAQSRGLFIANSLPAPLAADIVGTIIAVGPGVDDFVCGEKVFTFANPTVSDQGGSQEFAIFRAEYSAKVPRELGDDEAATLALNPLTAFMGLFRKEGLGIPPPEPFAGRDEGFEYGKVKLLVVGGGSAVGKYVVQWGRYAGIGTIVVTASRKNEELLRRLGATHVVDRNGGDEVVEREVRDVVGDELTLVFDAVNVGQDQEIGARFLSTYKKGTLVVVAGGAFDASRVKGKNAGFERKMMMAEPSLAPKLVREYWERLPRIIEEGHLSPTPYSMIQGLDAEKVNAVIADYNTGRPVVKPHIHL